MQSRHCASNFEEALHPYCDHPPHHDHHFSQQLSQDRFDRSPVEHNSCLILIHRQEISAILYFSRERKKNSNSYGKLGEQKKLCCCSHIFFSYKEVLLLESFLVKEEREFVEDKKEKRKEATKSKRIM